MDLEKILKLLGVDKINEEQQEELKTGLQTLIDVKADEKSEKIVEDKLAEAKTALTEEMEKKFDEYKDDVTSKFSNFVDGILEEEMVIPEKVLKFAKQGELYADLIEQFKVRLGIDEGLINDEAQELLREAKEEIVGLKGNVNSLMGDKLELEKDAQEMAATIYIRKKCDGLTEAKRAQVIRLLEGAVVKEEIDKKYALIVESLGIDEGKAKKNEDDTADDKKNPDTDEPDDDDTVMAYECPECGAKATIKEGDDVKCSECGATMKKVVEKKSKNEGKGKSEVQDDVNHDGKKPLTEGQDGELTPWQKMKQEWVRKL